MATHVTNLHGNHASSSSSRVFEVLTTHVARGAFALPFAVFGLLHVLNAKAMAGMVPIPGGAFWIYLTGFAMIAGSISLLTGKLAKWAGLGLAALMGVFIVTMHVPALSNPAMAQMATIGILKDTALLGGALTWAGLLSKK